MANYNSFTTSNFFKVKDLEAFISELEEMQGEDLFEYKEGTSCIAVAIYGDLFSCDEEDNDYNHDDYVALIQKHMEDDEKVFISSVGHEKLRYLGADCTIVTKDDVMYYNLFDMISKECNDGASIF